MTETGAWESWSEYICSQEPAKSAVIDVQLAFIYAVPAPTQRIVLPRVKMDLLTSINISRTILLFTGMARDFVFWVMLNAVRLAINTNCLWYHFLDVWSGFK